eukprot:gene9868-biopygen15281
MTGTCDCNDRDHCPALNVACDRAAINWDACLQVGGHVSYVMSWARCINGQGRHRPMDYWKTEEGQHEMPLSLMAHQRANHVEVLLRGVRGCPFSPGAGGCARGGPSSAQGGGNPPNLPLMGGRPLAPPHPINSPAHISRQGASGGLNAIYPSAPRRPGGREGSPRGVRRQDPSCT